MERRKFTRSALMAGAAATAGFINPRIYSQQETERPAGRKYRFSLNAYSFDKPLRSGAFNLEKLLEYCASEGFDGADLTGYYFPGYPLPPDDPYIYRLRKKAFLLGIELGCTGVKNDFTWADPVKRAAEKDLVKNWVKVAHKLGAPGLRIFAGSLSRENYTWKERAGWIASDIRECADFAASHGVMLALQNHNDFLKTADDVSELFRLIDHEWVGLMLDIGSYHTADPYSDIERNIDLTVTWQIKEKVFIGDLQVETDFDRLAGIIEKSSYRGYLPLETLGEGDPQLKVPALFKKVKGSFSRLPQQL